MLPDLPGIGADVLCREFSSEEFLAVSMQSSLALRSSLLDKVPSSQDGAGLRQAWGSASKSQSSFIMASLLKVKENLLKSENRL